MNRQAIECIKALRARIKEIEREWAKCEESKYKWKKRALSAQKREKLNK